MLEQIGRYKVLSELGRGAMGVVYKAQDPTIGRMVAIKTIRLNDLAHPEEREQLRSRLFREAQSAGILSHPGIVTIYDIAEEASLAYIAMEFVEGQTLEKMLEQGTVDDAKYVVSVATQTAIALDYAHSKGIIHRDIKPGNIMVNNEGAVKITDFGIARITSSKFTHTGTVMGTPSYMSPEQVRGAVVDGRSDMFSLSVVLYEMLTGQKPFSGDSITTVIFKIVSENPVPPKELNPSVGSKVNAVVMRALAKEPADRYQSCKEFAEALQLAVAQTANLTPTVRKLPSMYAGAEASDPAMATLPDQRAEAVGAQQAAPASPQDLETVVSPMAPKLTAEAPALEETKLAAPPPPVPVEKKLPPLEMKEAPAALRPVEPAPAEKKLPPLEAKVEAKPEVREPAPEPAVQPAAAAPKETLPAPPIFEEPPRKSRTGLVAALVVAAVAVGGVVFWQRSQSPAPAPSESASQSAAAPSTPPPLEKPQPPAPAPSAAPAAPAPEAASSAPPESAGKAPVEKPTAAKPAAPPASTGEVPKAGRVINITTTVPGARVVVDSKDDAACTTPCSVPVGNGRHTLLFTQTGFHAESREVVVAGKPVDVQLALRPVVGTVMLATNPPGAAVTVDGKAVDGQTPLQLKLPPGAHVIAATKEGAGSSRQTVEVTDDALIPVRMTLSPQ
ncbi:MAG TPA: protein kinase [Bryobacterales bacterium]|nr:protein kinase [Bryobacterales bacterium]